MPCQWLLSRYHEQAEVSICERPSGPRNLKYVLSGAFRTKFAFAQMTAKYREGGCRFVHDGKSGNRC